MESKDRIEMPIYVTDEHGNKRQVDSLVFVRERTCKQEERGWGTEGDHARVWLTCGHDCMVPTVQDLPNYCPKCGAKVLRNTPKCSETTTKVVGE